MRHTFDSLTVNESFSLTPTVVFGQDEVLAVSRKMVVRVEDLMRWSCVQPSCWSSRAKAAATCGTNGVHRPLQAEANGGGGTLEDKTESKERLIHRGGASVAECPGPGWGH